MYLLKEKHMKRRKSIKIFWVRKFYDKNEKKKEDFRNVVMAATIAVLCIIPCYSHVYRHKGVQGTQFSKL